MLNLIVRRQTSNDMHDWMQPDPMARAATRQVLDGWMRPVFYAPCVHDVGKGGDWGTMGQ